MVRVVRFGYTREKREIMAGSVRADILDLIDDGLLTAQQVAHMALCFMSVADLEDMMRANDVEVRVQESVPEYRFTVNA